MKDDFLLPTINDILDEMRNSKYFTVLDANSGYHQIPVWRQDQDKTCMVTRSGTYNWKVMPFGLCTAPNYYQRIMDIVFRELLHHSVLNYIDDTVVYLEEVEDHLIHLTQVFERLRTVGIRLSIKKCYFGYGSLDLLDHTISAEGTKIQPQRVEKILKIAAPTTRKQLNQFLGITS